MDRGKSECVVCGGTGWIEVHYAGDEMERQPPETSEEKCWKCNPQRRYTVAELCDQYDQLRARGYSNDEAAAYVDAAMEEVYA
jgi:hypothetical protein